MSCFETVVVWGKVFPGLEAIWGLTQISAGGSGEIVPQKFFSNKEALF